MPKERMKKPDFSDSYQIINVIFAAVILMIFLYSGLFRAEENYPISSQYRIITGEETQSTGLSRAFSEMVRLNFQKAKAYNESSPEVFGFFFLQLLLRIVLFFLYNRTENKKLMIRFDAAGSAILFLLCFRNFIFPMYS